MKLAYAPVLSTKSNHPGLQQFSCFLLFVYSSVSTRYSIIRTRVYKIPRYWCPVLLLYYELISVVQNRKRNKSRQHKVSEAMGFPPLAHGSPPTKVPPDPDIPSCSEKLPRKTFFPTGGHRLSHGMCSFSVYCLPRRHLRCYYTGSHSYCVRRLFGYISFDVLISPQCFVLCPKPFPLFLFLFCPDWSWSTHSVLSKDV